MRVLLISHSYSAGGAARYVRELHRELPSIDVDARVWVADPPAASVAGVEHVRGWLEPVFLPMDFFPGLTDWRHRGSIRRLDSTSRGDVDLVHMNLMSGGWCSMSAMSRLCKRMPVVWTHHDEWAANNVCYLLEGKIDRGEAVKALGGIHRLIGLSSFHESFKSRSLGALLDRVKIQPAVHVCPSQYMAGIIRGSPRFQGQPIVVVPNGTALACHPMAKQDRTVAREALGIPKAARVILMVSANTHDLHKGFHLAVNALKSLHARRPVHLLILGRGSEAFGSLMAPVPITAGFASSDAELARAYRAADITLIPSLADNFPYVAIESLACGTPFVSFRVGGLIELAAEEKHALLASCFDPVDLARCIETCMVDVPRRTQMGELGRQWVERECTLPVMLGRLKSVYAQAREDFLAAQGRK